MPPVQGGNDCAVRVGKLSFAIGLDRVIIAQNDSEAAKVSFFVRHGEQLPVAVSGRDFVDEDRGSLSIARFGCETDAGDHSRDRQNRTKRCSDWSHPASDAFRRGSGPSRQASGPSHTVSPLDIRNAADSVDGLSAVK
jgi:hypothetical protein